MADFVYLSTQESPAIQLIWKDSTGTPIDFSTGYTFKVMVSQLQTALINKTTGITGAATAPNVTIAWAANELNITEGVYDLIVIASTGSNDRVFRPGNPPQLQVVKVPT